MAKLHEILAAQDTPMKAWHAMIEDTLKKFKAADHYFNGHEKTLSMIEDSPANTALAAAARESKPVVTNVFDTLKWALDIFADAEDLQYQKNQTNRSATADIMWHGKVLLSGVPVDELLGLEARLVKIRELIATVPTLDAALNWVPAQDVSPHVFKLAQPHETTKTEKRPYPFVKAPATEQHPAQVEVFTKDEVVGTFITMKFTGAATAVQKSDALVNIDLLMREIKQARMRANEVPAVVEKIAAQIVEVILKPLA